jgi:hypothetical protein
MATSKVKLRAVGAAHKPIAHLGRHLGIHATAPEDATAPVELDEAPDALPVIRPEIP